jgi:hypothetical protein
MAPQSQRHSNRELPHLSGFAGPITVSRSNCILGTIGILAFLIALFASLGVDHACLERAAILRYGVGANAEFLRDSVGA